MLYVRALMGEDGLTHGGRPVDTVGREKNGGSERGGRGDRFALPHVSGTPLGRDGPRRVSQFPCKRDSDQEPQKQECGSREIATTCNCLPVHGNLPLRRLRAFYH